MYCSYVLRFPAMRITTIFLTSLAVCLMSFSPASGEVVTLRTENDRRVKIALNQLSKADQEFFKRLEEGIELDAENPFKEQ